VRRLWLALMLWLLSPTAWGSEIVVWHTWRGVEAEALESASERWTRDSGVVVRLVGLPFGAFDSKLETAVPRGNGPDVFLAAHGSLGKWTGMDLVEAVPSPLDGQRAAAVQAVTVDGRVWGQPLAMKSLVLLYDPTRVRSPPTTTDELVVQAKALMKADGGYGLAWQSAGPYFHAAFAHGFDATTLDPDGTVNLDSAGHVAAYALARRLAVEEGIAPAQPTAELIGRLYRDGEVPFVISGPWFVAGLESPIAAAPLPIVSETGQPMVPFLTVDAAFVATQAKQPAAAAQFSAWLAGPQGALIRQELGGQAVSHQGVHTTDPMLKTLLAQAEVARPIPTDPNVLNVFEAQARSLRALMRGAATPQQAASAAQTYYSILSRPPPPPVSPWPYVGVMGLVLIGLIGVVFAPLQHAGQRARLRAHWRDYLWIAPAGIAMSFLVILPFVTGASVSLFAHWRGEWSFVGFRHFADLLLSRDWPISHPLSFVYTMAVTVLWTATNLVLHVGIGVLLAMVLREPWIRLRGVWRAALVLPWAIPNYITALIWKGMFHAQYGAVNAVLGLVIGSEVEIDWFASFATGFCANLATNTWLGFPFMMVVTLGALQSIPRELEEAAEIDGAGAWFRFRHVVWPLLKPALLPAIVLGSVWTFNMFNVVYLVSAGEPNSSTEILISDAYRWAFSRGNRYGYAAAYSVIIFFVLLGYSRLANRAVGRKVI
jgi:arabinogalactan oligomer/maltooligosaccharide transport system permease protein